MAGVIKAVIIDDEQSAIVELAGLLQGVPGITLLAEVNNPSEAVPAILELEPDLLFLDIQMPGKSGFQIVEELRIKGFLPMVIFVTAFDKFAIEAIRHSALDYLVKPVDAGDLSRAVERIRETSTVVNQAEKIGRLLEKALAKTAMKFSTSGGFIMIHPEEILYIHADWNYSEIFFDGEKAEVITSNIGTLETSLPANTFFRVSRSIIINTSYLKKVSRKKRMAYLNKEGKEYAIKIPLLNIRKLEKFLER